RRDVAELFRGFFRDLAEGRLVTSATPAGRMAKLIIVGTVPVVVVGLLFAARLKATFYNPLAIAVVAIVFALLMAAAEWWAARRKHAGRPERAEDDLTYLDAVLIGCFQALALMPGGSRSGTTITAGLFVGLARPAAARFSFLLSLPAVLAAGVKELYDEYKKLSHPEPGEPPSLFASGDEVTALAVGTLGSAV